MDRSIAPSKVARVDPYEVFGIEEILHRCLFDQEDLLVVDAMKTG
jgi:hypothetical protein